MGTPSSPPDMCIELFLSFHLVGALLSLPGSDALDQQPVSERRSLYAEATTEIFQSCQVVNNYR